MMTELKEKTKQVIVEHLEVDPDKLDGNTSFSKELGLDSLDAMDLLLAIDEAFDIRVPTKDMAEIDTLDELVSAIEDAIDSH